MAAPAILSRQHDTATTPISPVITGVNAGERLVCTITNQVGGVARSHSITDSQGNTWSLLRYSIGTSRHTGIWTAVASATGTCTLTISTTVGTDYVTKVLTFRLEASDLLVSGKNESLTTTKNHVFAATPGVDFTPDATAIGSAVFNGTHGGITLGSGYTEELSASNGTSALVASKSFTGPITGETGAFTTGSNREQIAVFAVFGNDVGDVTAPSATVGTSGNQLTFVFDEDTNNYTGFTISPSGGAATLTYSSGDGSDTLVFDISRTITSGETLTYSYSAGDVEDLAGNALATISAVSVTNNSTYTPDVVDPTLDTATVTAATELTLVFDEAVTISSVTGLSLNASGGVVTLSTPTGSGTATIQVTTSRTILSTESLQLVYDSGTGDIEDIAGNALASISSRLVANNLGGSGGGFPLIGSGLIQ